MLRGDWEKCPPSKSAGLCHRECGSLGMCDRVDSMKPLIVLAIGISTTLSFAQAATTLTSAGGTFTIHSGSYQGSSNLLSGGADFFANGVSQDFAFQDMWAYRISGDSREYMVTSPNATFNNTSNHWEAHMFKGQNGSDTGPMMIAIDVDYDLGASSPTSPILTKCVRLTNLTNQVINFSLFHYQDYDIPGNANDFFSLHNSGAGTDLIQLRDTFDTGNYAETFFAGVGGPVSFQHASLYDPFFTNPFQDQMNNSVDGGSGDFAMGFQLDATLAPGQTSVCPGCYTALNGSVPEPVTAIAITAGLSHLLLRKKKRASK